MKIQIRYKSTITLANAYERLLPHPKCSYACARNVCVPVCQLF